MKTLQTGRDDILLASEVIKQGGLVAFPTETVYGLGADAFNPIAVAKIFEVKERPEFNPLIIHVGNKDHLMSVSLCCDNIVEKLIERFWPGPLTLVLPKKDVVPDIVTAGNNSVAVRMPSNPLGLIL